MQTKIFSQTKEKTIFTKSFMVSGFGFLAIMLIGIISWKVVDSAGLLKDLNTNTKFDFSIYRVASNLRKLSIVSGILIFASLIMSIFWAFRIHKASKTFMHVVFSLYVIGQGFGFGVLFATWNALELISIFGIGGAAFVVMGLIGYFSKDLSFMGRALIGYSIVLLVAWLISFLLIQQKIITAKFSHSFITFGIGVLFLGYTAYDVWLLKKTSEWNQMNGQLDSDGEYRLVMFFGFRLLVDLIGLIWTLARILIMLRD